MRDIDHSRSASLLRYVERSPELARAAVSSRTQLTQTFGRGRNIGPGGVFPSLVSKGVLRMSDGSFSPCARDVACQLSVIQAKVDEIAERVGVPAHERLSLESTLAAMPWPTRRHLGLVLQAMRVHSENPALVQAVNMVLSLAAQVWNNRVPGVTDETERVSSAAHPLRRNETPLHSS